jgi:HEAT repeat protein
MPNLTDLSPELRAPDLPLADWLTALSHDSPFERPPAEARGRPAPPLTALGSLISLLSDSDRTVRYRAVAALGELGAQAHRALPLLRAALKEKALKDDSDAVRARAVQALLQTGPQPDSEVAALGDALRDEVDEVRFHAAVALGDLGRAARPAVATLIHAHRWDEDAAVRVAAAVALWKIDRQGPVVIPALVKALADDNELLCWVAADCLGQIGPEAREAVPALRQALGRPFKIALIRKGVALALRRIDPQPQEEGPEVLP